MLQLRCIRATFHLLIINNSAVVSDGFMTSFKQVRTTQTEDQTTGSTSKLWPHMNEWNDACCFH